VFKLDPKETLGFNLQNRLNQKAPNISIPPLVILITLVKRKVKCPRKYSKLIIYLNIMVFLQSNILIYQFRASRQKEITRLLEKGVFNIVLLVNVSKGIQLFNS
jgi:hypothetical protein